MSVVQKDLMCCLLKNNWPWPYTFWRIKAFLRWRCVSTVPLFLCVNCSSGPCCKLFLWSYVSSVSFFFWSCVSKGSLVLWTICFSDPVCPLFLCSWMPTVPLFLSAYCSPGPVCPLFLHLLVSKGPLVHCAQSPMVLWTSDPVCPLLLCSWVPTENVVLHPHHPSSSIRLLFSALVLCPLVLGSHCSFVPQCLLSPVPVCPLFLLLCVPKGPLVHCAQSPMVLWICCFSDPVCPLLLYSWVPTEAAVLHPHRPSFCIRILFSTLVLCPFVLGSYCHSRPVCSLSLWSYGSSVSLFLSSHRSSGPVFWLLFRAYVTAFPLVPGAHFDSTGPVRPPSLWSCVPIIANQNPGHERLPIFHIIFKFSSSVLLNCNK